MVLSLTSACRFGFCRIRTRTRKWLPTLASPLVRCRLSTAERPPNFYDNNTASSENAANVLPFSEQWREMPDLNPVFYFPTLQVCPEWIQRFICASSLQPFLASTFWSREMNHASRRLRIVQESSSKLDPAFDSNGDHSTYKLILLHPRLANDTYLQHGLKQALQDLVKVESPADTCTTSIAFMPGPSVSVQLKPKDFTLSHVLSLLLPDEFKFTLPTSFETIGHVAHLNLPRPLLPYRYMIGQALLECLAGPSIKTVIYKTDSVSGPYRTYHFEVLAGRHETVVHHVEHGIKLEFDIKFVYWCSRLSEERKRMVTNIFQPGDVIADAFCGVGALCLQAAKYGCHVIANDWNPCAIEALNVNAMLNRVKIKERCGDAYKFLIDIGLNEYESLPDHIVMNYPLDAPRFLGALRWWRSSKERRGRHPMKYSSPRVHVYTFARADGVLTAEDAAVNAVATHLVVRTTRNETFLPTSRANELNEYGCKVQVHLVREVAPGKKVVRVSFSATDMLIQYMRGDFP